MRRRRLVTALVLLAFLAAGVVVSVGVAWGIELVRAYRAMGATSSEMAEWMLIDDPYYGGGWLSVGVIRGFGREEWTADRQPTMSQAAPEHPPLRVSAPTWYSPPQPGIGKGASTRAYGLPVRCATARMERSLVRGPGTLSMRAEWRSAWKIDLKKEGFVATLPLRPIWTGLLIDSSCFAGLIAAPWWVRGLVRWRRKGRGMCVWCGYDLKGLGGKCPECGRD